MSLASKLIEKFGIDSIPVVVLVECASTSPFTVYVAGQREAVDAVRMDGSIFVAGDKGKAIWQSGSKPICFKTT